MNKTAFPKFLKLSVVTLGAGVLASCTDGYTTPSSYQTSAPTRSKTQSNSLVSNSKHVKPTVKFPTRLAVVKVKDGYGGKLTVAPNQHVERPEYAQTISELEGLKGMVNLNNTTVGNGSVSYTSLRRSARNLGADMLGIYKFNTSTQDTEGPAVIQFASLGFAPVNSQKSVSAVSLILMDAKTGYVYGVLEESDKSSRLSSSWTTYNARSVNELKSKQKAMDKLMKKVPTFWNRIVTKHSS